MAKYLAAYDRAQESGAILRIPALNKGYYAKGKQIGWMLVRERPTREMVCEMTAQDLLDEGGMCEDLGDFVNTYFGGTWTAIAWVIRYKFVPLEVTE